MQKNEKRMERLFGRNLNRSMEGSASVPGLLLNLAAEMEKTACCLRMAAASIPPTEKTGLYLPAELLEDAGFFHVTGLDDLSCTIEEGRILLEPLEDEVDEAEIWDALREELPDELCDLLEDAGISPQEVWDALENGGWFVC